MSRFVPPSLLAVLLLAAAQGCSWDGGPAHQGKTLDAWLGALESPSNSGLRLEACNAVEAMAREQLRGDVHSLTELAPRVVALLADDDEAVRRAAAAAVVALGPVATPFLERTLLAVDAPLRRLNAAIALLELRHEHGDAMGVLMESFTDFEHPELAERATLAVFGMRERIEPNVTRLLRDPYPPVRARAAEMLSRLRR